MKLYLVNGSSLLSTPFETNYLLQTFYGINSKTIEEIKIHIDRYGNDNFILDSGAFSLFSGTGKNMNYEKLKSYIDDYCDFIVRYNIKHFIEMDIDKIIGYEEVKRIRKYIENKVGRKSLYVYHTYSRSIEDLVDACKEREYIFFGGLVKETKDFNKINSFIDFLYGYGVKCHLLGHTPPDLENYHHLYSCDSSSWTMGARSGIIFNFENDKLVSNKLEDMKRTTYYQLNNHNFKQWIKYQKYLKGKCWITE